MKPFDVYQNYLSLKRHFSSEKYSYFLYRGKVKVDINSFNNRNDKHKFEKLSKHLDPFGFLLSNIKDNPDFWIGDIDNEECQEKYYSWKKRIDSLSYTIKQETNIENFYESFLVKDQYPELLRLNRKGKVSDETLVLLNRVINFLPMWDKKIKEKYIWPSILFRLQKYDSFVPFEKEQLETLVKNIAREKQNVI